MEGKTEKQLVTRQEIPDNLIYKYTDDNMVKDGDFAVFWDGPDNKTQTVLTKRGNYQTRNGKIKHDDIIDKVCFGSKVFQRFGYTIILRPDSNMYSASLV